MDQYNLEKLKAVMLYILSKCDGIDKYRFSKIFYFANREHLVRFGREIVNADLKAFEFICV